jgi:hypothetical protein
MVFEKSPEGSAAASNNRARQQTQKAFAKTLQILLRKNRPPMP